MCKVEHTIISRWCNNGTTTEQLYSTTYNLGSAYGNCMGVVCTYVCNVSKTVWQLHGHHSIVRKTMESVILGGDSHVHHFT